MEMKFDEAIDAALAQGMAEDPRVVVIGEDVHLIRMNLFVRFGPGRVRAAPISESAFVGAAVSAAMAGLRPVVEVLLVDFIGVAMDALINHAAKVEAFSGGKWKVPLVIRATCGGGYGDAGQHMQSLWGWLAHIPGLSVVVPSNPADAGGLMLAALQSEGPVIYLEHKLLSEEILGVMGKGGRKNVEFDVPSQGAFGTVHNRWQPELLGRAQLARKGNDLTIVSLGVGLHRSMQAADELEHRGHSVEVIDLRTVSPMDVQTVAASVGKTKRLLVVDEDYEAFGLSGEVAAQLLERGLEFKYGRVCTQTTIPYARSMEYQAIPNLEGIVEAAQVLITNHKI